MAARANTVTVPATGTPVALIAVESARPSNKAHAFVLVATAAMVVGGKDMTLANNATKGFPLGVGEKLGPITTEDQIYGIAPAGATTAKVLSFDVA
jgi:hypothetical protein